MTLSRAGEQVAGLRGFWGADLFEKGDGLAHVEREVPRPFGAQVSGQMPVDDLVRDVEIRDG
ncbi:MAG: hypothetical protein ACRDT4_26005 [Micromonosporaceae bacterium]